MEYPAEFKARDFKHFEKRYGGSKWWIYEVTGVELVATSEKGDFLIKRKVLKETKIEDVAFEDTERLEEYAPFYKED